MGEEGAKQEAEYKIPVTPQAFMQFTQSSFTDINKQLREFMEAFDSFQVAEKRRMQIATMDEPVGIEVGVDAEQQVVDIGEGPITKLILEQLNVVTDEIDAARRRLSGAATAGGSGAIKKTWVFKAGKKSGDDVMFWDRTITVDEKCFSWTSQRLGTKGNTRKLCFKHPSSGARNCKATFGRPGHAYIEHAKREITVEHLYEGYGIERTLRLKNMRNIRNFDEDGNIQHTLPISDLWAFIMAQCEKRND